MLIFEKAISEVVDRRLQDDSQISVGSSRLAVKYTPGHTDDAISILGEGRIFTGDVLLIGSVGRTDFQNGSPESMFDTLQQLKTLPEETLVFPGHDYHQIRFSTIAKEKKNNPYLKEENKQAFVQNMRLKKIPKPFNIDNIVRVNQKGQVGLLEMVSPSQAQEIVKKDSQVKFLDVRSPLEFSQAHIKDSINIPIDVISTKIDELSADAKRYIVFCRTGNRSPMAADILIQSGINGVKVMDGGITEWQKKRLPVIKGKTVVSLERQVRGVAGSLVLSGMMLSWWINPAFISISIFVCCGLIFSAITDSCLMGMLLLKLPYNKKMFQPKSGGGTCSIS